MKAYGIYYQKLNELNELSKRDPNKALKILCAEFESLLWYEILKDMEKATIKGGLFPETFEKRIYQDFLYQEIARAVSGKPRGLGDYLYQTLTKSAYFRKR